MTVVAKYAATGALVAGSLLLVLAGLGFKHAAVAAKPHKPAKAAAKTKKSR